MDDRRNLVKIFRYNIPRSQLRSVFDDLKRIGDQNNLDKDHIDNINFMQFMIAKLLLFFNII